MHIRNVTQVSSCWFADSLLLKASGKELYLGSNKRALIKKTNSSGLYLKPLVHFPKGEMKVWTSMAYISVYLLFSFLFLESQNEET